VIHLTHFLLALAALFLVGVVAAQDYFYPPLRTETISQGLNGPNHVWLDAACVLVGVALVLAASGPWQLAFAGLTLVGLLGICVTNTAWRWVDGLTGRLGGHESVHLVFTALVFVGALLFELAANDRRLSLWLLTTAGVGVPLVLYELEKRTDIIEKAAVALLCAWLVAWSLA